MKTSSFVILQKTSLHLMFSPSFWRKEPLFVVSLLFGMAFGTLLLAMVFVPNSVGVIVPDLRPLMASTLATAGTAAVFCFTFLFGVHAACDAHERLIREANIGRIVDDRIFQSQQQLALAHGVLGWAIEGMTTFFTPDVEATKGLRAKHSLHSRIVTIIDEDAKHMRYEPVTSLLERFWEEIANGGPRVKVWQHVAVRLGILLTFVGLVFALIPIRGILNLRAEQIAAPQNSDVAGQMAVQIANIVDNLALAFGASISGLIAALLLQCALMSVSRRENALGFEIGRRIGSLQLLAQRARNDTVLSRTLDSLRVELEAHKRQLYASIQSFDDNARALLPISKEARERSDEFLKMLARQNETIARNEKLAESLSTVDARLGALFDARLAAATQASIDQARHTADVMKAIASEIIAEVREGFGRDARHAIENVIAERFETLEHAIGQRDEAHVSSALTVVRSLAIGLGLCLAVGICATGLLVAKTMGW